MNREALFRLLTVAVIAPFIYTVSDDQKSVYFRIGLKLVAGSLIAMNIAPLLNDYQVFKRQAKELAASLANAQQTLAKTARTPTTIEAESIEEATLV